MKNRYGVVYNDASFFYIQTDKDAPTGKVIALPVANPDIANAKVIIEAKPEVLTASSAGQLYLLQLPERCGYESQSARYQR